MPFRPICQMRRRFRARRRPICHFAGFGSTFTLPETHRTGNPPRWNSPRQKSIRTANRRITHNNARRVQRNVARVMCTVHVSNRTHSTRTHATITTHATNPTRVTSATRVTNPTRVTSVLVRRARAACPCSAPTSPGRTPRTAADAPACRREPRHASSRAIQLP